MIRSFEHFDTTKYQTTPDALSHTLGKTGLAIVDFDRPVTAPDMLDIAYALGTPIKETTPLVLEHSDPTGHVVRISSRRKPSQIMAEQVLSTSDMGMHLDHALAPTANQPRIVMLGCEIPPPKDNGGQTLISDTTHLFQELSKLELNILANSYPRIIDPRITDPGPAADYFLRTRPDGERYFSYWDAGRFDEAWDLQTPDNIQPDVAKDIIERVRDITERHAKAIPWEVGRVAVWDNHRYLHGRTEQTRPSDRSLLRAKVLVN